MLPLAHDLAINCTPLPPCPEYLILGRLHRGKIVATAVVVARSRIIACVFGTVGFRWAAAEEAEDDGEVLLEHRKAGAD